MSQIVCVHGIGQQLKGPKSLEREWRDALRDGMVLAGAGDGELPGDTSIAAAFYGDLFRGRKGGDEPAELADIDPGFETELLMRWGSDAGLNETGENKSDQPGKSGWAPKSVQRLAQRILRHKFFARVTDKAFVGDLKQVRWYLTESDTRQKARKRVASLISDQTRVVIAHSLGSVVAYEVLCQCSVPVHTFITLGSPIGLPNLVFERLDPAPTNGRGNWPHTLSNWVNIADIHDIVASVKQLSPLFWGRVRDIEVNNEAQAHDISPYFTSSATGKAVWDALRGQ
jgi:hypothetical protein